MVMVTLAALLLCLCHYGPVDSSRIISTELDQVDGKDTRDPIELELVVGGHAGAMILEGDKCWKLLQTVAGRGNAEAEFLKTVTERSDLDLLQGFVPHFFEVTQRGGGTYIVMSNLLQGLKAPALMDVKIGRETWAPDATPEKRAKMIKKAKLSTSWTTGFKVVGSKYRQGDGWQKWGKAVDRLVKEEDIQVVLDGYLHTPELRQQATERLSVLQSWFEGQREFAFYGSSLLFAYDTTLADPELKLGFIDFAHVHQCPPEGDLNFIQGLSALSSSIA